ncbi:hypothetical protein EP331_07145 [bacterium]|nr:MAG: hypothetical protein EP331_07145 [bacterium]
MLNHREILLIKMSWSYIVPMSDTIGFEFYSYLFSKNPEIKRLFENSIQNQSKKLMDTLTFIIVSLMHLNTLENYIEVIAMKHQAYPIQEEHYDMVGNALIHTLKVNLKQTWDKETEAAWIKLYNRIAEIMISTSKKHTVSHLAS